MLTLLLGMLTTFYWEKNIDYSLFSDAEIDSQMVLAIFASNLVAGNYLLKVMKVAYS